MAQAHYFRKGKSLFSTTLVTGIGTGTSDTITLSSVAGLPTDTEITLTFDRVDQTGEALPAANMERITGIIVDSNFTAYTRAVEGTERAHLSGCVIEYIPCEQDQNDLIDGLLVEHLQTGRHSLTSPKVTTSINDSNGNEIIKTPATASAVNELTITNAATGNAPVISATGGDDNIGLTFQSKGTGSILIQEGGVNPWRTITLNAGVLKPTTTAGCASVVTVEAGTNDIDYDVIDFDKATDENAFVNFQMPDSWDAGVIQFRFTWTAAAGTADQTVVMELSGISLANDDAIDTAVGTAVEVSDALIATGDVHTSAWSGDVTLAGTPVAGEWVHLELMRDISEDNLDADARIINVQIRYKQAKYSD